MRTTHYKTYPLPAEVDYLRLLNWAKQNGYVALTAPLSNDVGDGIYLETCSLTATKSNGDSVKLFGEWDEVCAVGAQTESAVDIACGEQVPSEILLDIVYPAYSGFLKLSRSFTLSLLLRWDFRPLSYSVTVVRMEDRDDG